MTKIEYLEDWLEKNIKHPKFEDRLRELRLLEERENGREKKYNLSVTYTSICNDELKLISDIRW